MLVEPKFCSAGQPLPGLLIGQLGQPARAGSGGLLTPVVLRRGRVRFRQRAWVRSSSLAEEPCPGRTMTVRTLTVINTDHQNTDGQNDDGDETEEPVALPQLTDEQRAAALEKAAACASRTC